MASSIVTLSVIDAWKEGATVDAIKAVQAKIEAVAQSLADVAEMFKASLFVVEPSCPF